MQFEYNANLTFDERVEVVTQEIMNNYPEIPYEKAFAAASMSTPIDDKPSNDDLLDRYICILNTIGQDNVEYTRVFNDAFDVYSKGVSDRYISLMENIIMSMSESE